MSRREERPHLKYVTSGDGWTVADHHPRVAQGSGAVQSRGEITNGCCPEEDWDSAAEGPGDGVTGGSPVAGSLLGDSTDPATWRFLAGRLRELVEGPDGDAEVDGAGRMRPDGPALTTLRCARPAPSRGEGRARSAPPLAPPIPGTQHPSGGAQVAHPGVHWRAEPDLARLWIVAERIARGILRDAVHEGVDVDDVVQDVMLRLAKQGPWALGNPEAWVTTVTKRACLDVLRAHARHVDPSVDHDGPDEAVLSLPGRGQGPGEVALDRIVLQQVLDSLSERNREVLVLHLVGWSNAEIATELGYGGVATVASTLSRIKRDARARAGEYGWGLPSGLRQTG